mmetsp:Transcript_20964/g.34160  ORF Transcript_20964/g.34160 Transcript_20964/m.34160 type:complete len:232 (-) Transcript_20964:2016-2711(-)
MCMCISLWAGSTIRTATSLQELQRLSKAWFLYRAAFFVVILAVDIWSISLLNNFKDEMDLEKGGWQIEPAPQWLSSQSILANISVALTAISIPMCIYTGCHLGKKILILLIGTFVSKSGTSIALVALLWSRYSFPDCYSVIIPWLVIAIIYLVCFIRVPIQIFQLYCRIEQGKPEQEQPQGFQMGQVGQAQPQECLVVQVDQAQAHEYQVAEVYQEQPLECQAVPVKNVQA